MSKTWFYDGDTRSINTKCSQLTTFTTFIYIYIHYTITLEDIVTSRSRSLYSSETAWALEAETIRDSTTVDVNISADRVRYGRLW